MGVYIPNMKMPHNCIECPRLEWYTDEDGFDRSYCQERVLYPSTIDRPTDCPLIEIDESEMEYLYKEFGLEKDENLTVRAVELKYAILMGYAYAKREIVTCGECKHWYSDADCGMACEFTNMKQPSDGFCNWGERRTNGI